MPRKSTARLIPRCLPTKHLPQEIQRALTAARVRPAEKACFNTAARVVAFQDVVPLEYVEGWAIGKFGGIEHAWVRHATLGDVDLLLDQSEHTYDPVFVLDKPGVLDRIKIGTWGPWGPFAAWSK